MWGKRRREEKRWGGERQKARQKLEIEKETRRQRKPIKYQHIYKLVASLT